MTAVPGASSESTASTLASADGAASAPSELGSRLAQDSLFQATMQLEKVIASAPAIDPWIAEVHAAIQTCTLALEHHFLSVGAAGGMRDQIARAEPRLLRQIDRLDAELSSLLVEFWKAKGSVMQPQTALAKPLEALAAELRRLAGSEFDLERESNVATGGED